MITTSVSKDILSQNETNINMSFKAGPNLSKYLDTYKAEKNDHVTDYRALKPMMQNKNITIISDYRDKKGKIMTGNSVLS